jgi:hypothetical protein
MRSRSGHVLARDVHNECLEEQAFRVRQARKCYNHSVSNPPDSPSIERYSEGRRAGGGIPPIFVIGVVMMVVVVGGLMLRSTMAKSAVVPPTDSAAPFGTASRAIAPTVAPAVSVSPYLGLTGYVWPLAGPTITLPFGPSGWGEFFVDGQRFHDGVDMASACGDNVMAAHDGVVLAAGRQYDDFMGWVGDLAPYYNLLDTKRWWNSLPIVIVIDDGDGYRSIYAHESKVTVAPGQHVTAGQVIGYEGQTGNASGCHVHFGLFSPTEKATFDLDPAVVKADLILVLPFRCEFEDMRALRPVEAAPCPVFTTPSPEAGASPARASIPGPTAAPTGVGVR